MCQPDKHEMTYDSCSCDYEPPEFVVVETRKARKQHHCYECGCDVPPGETYEHVRGKWEGDISTFRTCALCLELRRWAVISVPCFCWAYGSVMENVRDMVSEVRPDVPAGFVFEWGRRVIKIQRRRHGQHWPRQWMRRRPRRTAREIAAEERSR